MCFGLNVKQLHKVRDHGLGGVHVTGVLECNMWR